MLRLDISLRKSVTVFKLAMRVNVGTDIVQGSNIWTRGVNHVIEKWALRCSTHFEVDVYRNVEVGLPLGWTDGTLVCLECAHWLASLLRRAEARSGARNAGLAGGGFAGKPTGSLRVFPLPG